MTARPYRLSDEEWEVVAEYVTGDASPAIVAAVERRLATEPAYAAHVAPILALWTIPLAERSALRMAPATEAVPEARAADDVETAAAWARLEAALTEGTAPRQRSVPRTLSLGDSAERLARLSTSPVHARASTVRWLMRPTNPWWRRSWAFGVLCACVLAIGAGVVYRVRHPAFRYTGGATGRVVTLPDHSTATLAPGAYLGTSHAFTSGTRAVYLFGQATFHVAPDAAHPFVVHVVGIDATALGTTFGITSDTVPAITVDVRQGKVAVAIMGADGVRYPIAVLTAGEAQRIPVLTRWMTQAGAVLGAAGVPFTEAVQIHDALVRGAAAVVAPHS